MLRFITSRPLLAKYHQLHGLCRYRCISTATSSLSLAYDVSAPTQSRNKVPIIFLHGLFGSKQNNRTVGRSLARALGRHVYTLDLRNHGDSPHNNEHTYSAMAQDVAHFIQEHGLQRATLIGHSMGAKAAMTLALQAPHLVTDLVSVDNAPVDTTLTRSFANYIRGMKKIEDAKVSRQSEADLILQSFEESLPIRQFLLTNLYRPSDSKTMRFRIPLGTLGRSLDHIGDFPFKGPTNVRFEGPTLFVRGTKSKYIPDDVLPLIGQFFPRFRLAEVQAGHWLISEQPEAFKDAIVSFLMPAA